MNTTQITKQIIDFNKLVFDNSFNGMVIMQDLTSKMMRTYMDQMPWLPEEGKKGFDDFLNGFRNGRDKIKFAVEEEFKKAGDCFLA